MKKHTHRSKNETNTPHAPCPLHECTAFVVVVLLFLPEPTNKSTHDRYQTKMSETPHSRYTHTPCSLHELTAVSVLAEAAVYEIQRRQERPTHPQQLQPVREQHQQHHQQGPPALSPPTRIQRSFDDEPNKNIRKDFRERFTSQETKFHPYTALCPRRRLLLSLRTAITIAHLV